MDKKEEKGASRERTKNREKEGAKKIRKKTESPGQGPSKLLRVMNKLVLYVGNRGGTSSGEEKLLYNLRQVTRTREGVTPQVA